MSDAIKQAKRELAEEKKREKVEEAKNVLRQIERLKDMLKELEAQIAKM